MPADTRFVRDSANTQAPTPHRGAAAKSAAAALLALVFGSLPATASAASERLDPVSESRRALVFAVDGIETESVTDAHVVMRSRRGTVRRDLGASTVRNAPRGRLKVRKPGKATGGKLVVTLAEEPSPAPAPEPEPSGDTVAPSPGGDPDPAPAPVPSPTPSPAPGSCDPAGLASLSMPGCAEAFSDPGSAADPSSLWGKTDCAAASRHRLVEAGSGSHRELTVLDGDDVWGERCELGRNDHRTGPTAVYREGDHAVTFASFRLPQNYPLEDTRWQVVMQMKQTQPSANGGGTPVLSLEAKGGRWRLLQSTSSGPSSDTRELWTTPAARGVWTRFALDVTYSQDPAVGSVQVHVDLDGDGDATGAGERSPRISTYTLKRETTGGSATDGIAPGESIPSHLRTGIYHHPDIPCPPPSGCTVEIDDVQILDAP